MPLFHAEWRFAFLGGIWLRRKAGLSRMHVWIHALGYVGIRLITQMIIFFLHALRFGTNLMRWSIYEFEKCVGVPEWFEELES